MHPACFFINQVGEAATPDRRRPEKHLPYLVNSSYFAHQLSSARDYLRILDLAAKQSETGVDAVLGRLLEWNVPITPTVVADHLAHDLGLPRAMEVTITTVDLSMYDRLLETREDMPLTDLPTCTSP